VPAETTLLAALPVLATHLSGGDPVLAYGPAPGMELIPYFLALLAWVAMALAGVLLWPISGLLRRLRRGQGAPPAEPKTEPTALAGPGSPTQEKPD
jgi:hypothetical protein